MSRIRIVGGQWRSRLLQVADVRGLRPTPDRVRETLFNWLGQDLTGSACVDLFAGSGILGFEAASRGAAPVVLVEPAAPAFAALQRSAKTLQASQVEIVRCDALKFAQLSQRQFDGAFIDPPYEQGWIARLEPLLDRIVKPQGWLYLEAEHAVTQLGPWRTSRQGRAGQVHFHLMHWSP